jgi:hypothetical protein
MCERAELLAGGRRAAGRGGAFTVYRHSHAHFAVGRNRWDWEAARLLEWQREKAGTIEARHDVLKNDLGAC